MSYTDIDNQSEIQLGKKERDKLFKKKYSELKIKVCLNCIELFALFAVTGIISHQLTTNILSQTSTLFHFGIAAFIGIVIVAVFFKIKRYQISINRFDREDIYKKISAELLKKKAKESHSKSTKKELIAS